MTWRDRAACLGTPTDVFYPDEPMQGCYEQALAICERCPVRTDCLTDAMQRERWDRYGVLGGMTPKQRQLLHRRNQRRAS